VVCRRRSALIYLVQQSWGPRGHLVVQRAAARHRLARVVSDYLIAGIHRVFVRRFVDEPKVFTATQNKLTAKRAPANLMEIPLLARDAEDSDFDVRAYDRCAGRVLCHRD
jgi:hypothetical protein